MGRIAIVFAFLSLVVAGCGETKPESRALPADEAARLLIDRNWMDIWPTSKDQRLHVFRFTPQMGGGVYQDRTLFRGTFELFRFEAHGGELRFDLPETGTKMKTSFRIERVDGPKPFDLKLTLGESPRGPRIYYGRTAETGATADPFAAALEN